MKASIKEYSAGELAVMKRVSCAFVAAILTLFTTQLLDMLLFRGRPAFSDINFVMMNLIPVLVAGLIGSLLRRMWLVSIILTIAGLLFAVGTVGFSHGLDPRALAQYFFYGTTFLWNGLYYQVACNTWSNVKEKE